MQTILFQGDSITDCLRDRVEDRLLGQGYPFAVQTHLGYEQPGKYHVLNRGVSGNRVVDLYARCKQDCWNLNPDYLSVLIGVNDTWHEFASSNGVELERYRNLYRMFLTETQARLPHCKMILMEPFCLCGTGTREHGYDAFRAEIVQRQDIVSELAQETGAALLTLQADFDALAAAYTPEYWLFDGVHPTPAGHGMIAAKWMELFGSIAQQ